MLIIILRRAGSLCRLAFAKSMSDGLDIPWRTELGAGCRIQATDGGRVVLGQGVHIGSQTHLVAQGGTIVVGDGVFIGHGCTVVSRSSIEVGHDSLLAEYVTIRDQDHSVAGHSAIAAAPFIVDPIRIGANAWVGAKGTVLRGSTVGDHAVIGANAVVKGDVPDYAIAVGIPARVVKRRDGCSG